MADIKKKEDVDASVRRSGVASDRRGGGQASGSSDRRVASPGRVPDRYIGLSPESLVKLVRDLSDGETQVVRDHGGPLQGGFVDDGTEAFDEDVEAGFDGLHVDVCELPRERQCEHLVELCGRYADRVDVEVGGEHESASWNTQLLGAVLSAGIRPSYVVVGIGTHVWADRQHGYVHDDRSIRAALAYARKVNIRTKMHNADWLGNRIKLHDKFDAYNLAPELGQVEVRAILTALPPGNAQYLLEYAYQTNMWSRWFYAYEGTHTERAECAIRYLLEDPEVIRLIHDPWSDDSEEYVRRCVRDAIANG